MMITVKSLRTTLFVLGVVLVIAACGGDDAATAAETAAVAGTTSTDTSTSDATSDATSSSTASSSSASNSSGEPGSLDDYLGTAANFVRGNGGGQGGGFGGGGTVDSETVTEEQRLIQQEIQRCMQAEGFEYTPEEVGDGLRFFLAGEQSTLSPAEYAETEGFGISTRFDQLLEGDIDLTEDVNPNDEHVATLSEGEADAWQLALRGEPPQRNAEGQLIDPETGEPLQGRPIQGGCSGEAQQIVRGDIESLQELADLFDEVEDRIEADPRLAEIARAWSTCMADRGFDYQDEGEARAAINEQVRPLLRSFFLSGQTAGDGAGDGDAAGGRDGQGQQGQAGGGNRLQAIAGLQLTAEQEAELNALQDLERSVAVTSVECQGGTAEEVEEIRLAYETEFVENNQSTLEALSR